MINVSNDIVLLNEDSIHVILTQINNPITYMNSLYLCTNIYSFLMKTYEDKIVSFNFGIMGLSKRYPELPWDKDMFISNRSIKMKDIINNGELFKGYTYTSPEVNDNYKSMKYWNDLTLDMIEEIVDINPHIPISVLFRDLKVYHNPNINFTTRITIPPHHVDFRWNNMKILELEALDKYNDGYVSCNKNVTMEIILNNPNFQWDWTMLSCNEGITIEDITSHPQFGWDYELSLRFKTIKEYFKYRHLFRNVNSGYIFQYIKISIEDFTLYPELLQLISSNLSLCSKNNYLAPHILNHFGLPIDYYYFSSNTNVTMDYVLKNINENWNWRELSRLLYK